ncbi:DNA repair protein rad8 [Pyrenophora tritici-repentis]|nr:DNA repair protein rad8 [Pyrenophora tritici-repentis]KAI0607875.1 DNA repair protein rad8 [Pyrenophora tritici-repentis]KAI1551112.1 Dcm Site-specific DNA methylase [Pyrenophora tritici-repentis]PZD28235.1 Dcm, Site-specific DNA methylase [Pyrenophora tritici-repentis]PZD37569.1 Dcm, Site-specific DNA methylase [Pyrenophora tritici-repentis]
MASANTRKRKRLTESAPTSLQGYTTTIASRQTRLSAARSAQIAPALSLSSSARLHTDTTLIASRQASSSAARASVALSSTRSLHGGTATIASRHTRSSEARSAQISQDLSRTNAPPTIITAGAASITSITTQAPHQMTEDTGMVIPEDCCYHCLNRGGNAAYECHKEEGKEQSEESVAIAARCPQCTRRGFKKCNGGHPCDTCIRNKTGSLCHKPSEKKVRLDGPAASKKSMAPPKSVDTSSQRKNENSRPSRSTHADTNKRSIVSSSITSPDATSSSMLDETTCNDKIAVAQTKIIARELIGYVQGEQSAPAERNVGRKLYSVFNKRVYSPLSSSLSSPLSAPLASGDETIDITNFNDIQLSDEDTATEKDTKPQATNRIGTRTRRSRRIVSYVEQTFDDDESDISMFSPTDDESDMNIEPISSEDDMDIDPTSCEDDTSGISDSESSVIMPLKNDLTAKRNRKQTGKGIDLSLPPLSNIEDCMSDMTKKSLQLGLLGALDHLKGRTIKVATMCSGTESPLLALDEICKALKVAGHSPPLIQQEFSAEIEVFKQAFIERNFHPKILFRDVRDFIDESSTKATTAYGAEVEIPIGIDILVAGFVCKDLSRLNNQGKSLEDGGETGDTWLAVHTYARRFRPSIVLLENVKSQKGVWDDVVRRWDNIGYEAAWIICDTKQYYLPQTRERMYMVAIERNHFGKGVTQAVKQWQGLMEKLKRGCSSPYEAFLPDSLRESSDYSSPSSETAWALAKLRYDHFRSEKRLGILSPISRRSDNGTIMPPDFADRGFYNSQSSRVCDAIDIAHLEASQKGCDSLYKMALWDVSQNVDRFKKHSGIAPCVTPTGRDFSSNRQTALNGSQLLVLQGMPMSRLLFANETEKELQNLAGNAMSTTVIGASLVAAIISGHKAFQSTKNLADAQNSAPQTIESSLDGTSDWSSLLSHSVLEPATYEQLDLVKLNEEALLSSRFCHCEGKKFTSKTAILTCSACGHSACTLCAGNPKHVYRKAEPCNHRTQTPDEFVRRWRPRLPARLKVNSVDWPSDEQGQNPTVDAYLEVISKAQISAQSFCLDEFSREHNRWKIEYSSPKATLQLRLGRDAQWLMYVKCQPHLPASDPIRALLKNPVAHGSASETLFNVEWKLRLPCTEPYQLRMTGSIERISSWRSRLGLPDHKAETVPAKMEIHSEDQGLTTITGAYEHLLHCGTACNSLYKRLGGEGNMYLFLDPDLIGEADRDSFVFSQDNSRKTYSDARLTVAQLDSSWRPWHMDAGRERLVAANVSDRWIPTKIGMKTSPTTLDVRYLQGSSLNEHHLQGCSQLLPVLDVSVKESLPNRAVSGHSWALEKARLLPSCSSWYEVQPSTSQECPCAPNYPKLIWSVDENGVASAHEDRQAAATFERMLKMRPKIFQINDFSDSNQTRIQIGVHVMSLIHRAQGRLSGHSSVKTAWRLLTDHFQLPSQPFPRFRLGSNANDVPQADQVAAVPRYLFDEQIRAVVWMKTQELGVKMTISETEESIHSGVGWRVEARAETELCVRGGVLADQPSFGKTVTSIALIQSEFDQYTPEDLIEINKPLAANLPVRLESAATLVVCPPHIALQWKTELKKFLGEDQFQLYNVLVVQNFAQLTKLTTNNLRQSRVIVVSWSLFFEKEYVSELADFAAMPEPTLVSRRAFDAWMTRAGNEIPAQLDTYLTHNRYKDFQTLTQNRIESLLQLPEFKASIPIRIQHGSAYESYGTTEPVKEAKKAAKPKREAATKSESSTRTDVVPLLHLFRFNRVVIDEYHYLNDDEKVETSIKMTAIKAIQSHKRWILSGTPALGGFSDVNHIASFLGIRLGRYVRGDGKFTVEKTAAKLDQTDVEGFLSQTESMSRQWHEERHVRAQEFLDKFARQNEAALQNIACKERLVPVELDAAHIAVYMELSQHLVPQRLQIRKLDKSSSDRNDRLRDSLENSSTPKEALLKAALLYETAEDGRSGLDLLTHKRSEELKSTRADLLSRLVSFEQLVAKKNFRRGTQATGKAEIVKLYALFEDQIAQDDYIGDEEAKKSIRDLLVEAKKARKEPNRSFSELKGKTDKAWLQTVKHHMSQLNGLCDELIHRTRSKRFVATIQDHLQPVIPTSSHSCSSQSCNGVTDVAKLFLVSHCGHTACQSCLEARSDDETCVHPGCKARLGDGELIPMANLGSKESHDPDQIFGKKLHAIVQLISEMPPADQGIIFAPNDDLMSVIERVLDHYKIRYATIRQTRIAQVIEEFKTNKKPATMKKLLILNLGNPSAAGINLINANHVFFVSPLHADDQYKYDSAMAQAIARSRRHGQGKTVHIYHVVALRTIDVDILEHRHKRTEAMVSTQSEPNGMWPLPCKKKEKTVLVRNRTGEMMLLPSSWLEDGQNRDLIDVDVSPERFTSPIKLSGTFDEEELEENE